MSHFRNLNLYAASLVVISVVFWALRIAYWSTHVEEPFADLLGYVQTADNIVDGFYFGFGPDRPVYYTPVTPLAIALAKLIGHEGYIWIFRYMIQAASFAGALALVRELAWATGARWAGLTLLFILAISRPSIFWSLKPATETVCEALLYCCAALALATVRRRSLSLAVATGIACLALGLNRPNFLPGALIVVLALLCVGVSKREGRRLSLPRFERRAVALAVAFALAFFATWSIWIGRNLVNYGMFVPTSTSGLVTMMWDYGGSPVRIGRYTSLRLADGSEYSNFGLNETIANSNNIAGEKARAEWLQMFNSAWFRANLPDLPRLFLWRLKNYVAFNGASGLTRVSREQLFEAPTAGYNYPFQPAAWLNMLLLDKTPTICLLGLVGLIILMWRAPALSPIFFGLALAPWLCGALVLGYERTVESLITFTIWLAFYGVAKTAFFLQRLDNRGWRLRRP